MDTDRQTAKPRERKRERVHMFDNVRFLPHVDNSNAIALYIKTGSPTSRTRVVYSPLLSDPRLVSPVWVFSRNEKRLPAEFKIR